MYRHPDVVLVRKQADQVVRDLFRSFAEDPARMPPEWREGLEQADEPRRMRRISDYIAGMTDRYALLEHRRLFDVTPDLR